MALITNTLIFQTILLCSLPVLVLFLRSLYRYQYWKKKKITFLKPSFPFGNFTQSLLLRKPFNVLNTEIYNKIKYELKKTFAGAYNITKPVLVVCDPDLIKHILIKDFDHFVDRGLSESDETRDPLEGHLFNKKGDEWRRLRNKLSPTFTSGKIKYMFPLIEKCSNHLVSTINKQTDDSKEVSLEMKDYCARYTTDVIGSAAFGLEINSLENPQSEFRQISQHLLRPNLFLLLKTVLAVMVPSLVYILRMKFIDPRISKFFFDLVNNNLDYREKNDIKRDDFLNIMMQLKHAQSGQTIAADDVKITNEVIAAQSFVFFFAGFETSSSALSFCLYELSRNRTLQSKLREEILSVKKELGELNYEAYQKMTLLDKVTKETLRKYPSLPQLDRLTVKEYQIPNTDVVLDVGVKILIPSMAIHYDPEYYPDPEKFDPERFSQENVENRPNYTYLPFGDGPRNCIGMRFGIIQFKSGLSHLISNFEFSTDPSCKGFEFMRGSLLLQTAKPIYLNVKRVSK